jgi:hypothetical protein
MSLTKDRTYLVHDLIDQPILHHPHSGREVFISDYPDPLFYLDDLEAEAYNIQKYCNVVRPLLELLKEIMDDVNENSEEDDWRLTAEELAEYKREKAVSIYEHHPSRFSSMQEALDLVCSLMPGRSRLVTIS